MDTSKNSSKPAQPTTAEHFKKSINRLSDHVEAQGGILAQVDAVRHISVVLSETLQTRLIAPNRDESLSGYVKVDYSIAEIDRIIWLAGEIVERGQALSGQMDALYGDLCEMTHEWASGRAAS